MPWSTPHLASPVRALLLLAIGVGEITGLAGCVLGNDSDPPVLSVDLYWLDYHNGRRSGESTCSSSDVASMDFQLLDANNGTVIVENEDDDAGHKCLNGFDFKDLGPGFYTLDVTGYDADHNKRWSGSCEVDLDRFDRLYPCNVEQLSAPGGGTTDEADAGT